MIWSEPDLLPTPESAAQIGPEHLEEGLLNVVVFGPGDGEAIVVVLPDGKIGVVDGCREPTSKNPVRKLLSALEAHRGTSCAPHRLHFVCVTHPHDDHYRGVGRLIRDYAGRIDNIWTVAPITGRYREALPRLLRSTWAGDNRPPDGDSLNSLDQLLHAVESVRRDGPGCVERLCLRRQMLPSEREALEDDVRIIACGPADYDVDMARDALVQALQAAGNQKSSGPSLDPNLSSGALLLRWGNAGVLLAGDLLNGKVSQSGWERCQGAIQGPVQIVNVAHHASREAHHRQLWSRIRPQLAIVTPFKNARNSQPPRPEMLDELSQTSRVIVTSPPSWMASRRPLNTHGALPPAVPGPAAKDIFNAVSTSVAKDGTLKRLVLGGKATFYSHSER